MVPWGDLAIIAFMMIEPGESEDGSIMVVKDKHGGFRGLLIACECGVYSRALFKDTLAAYHAGAGRTKGKRYRCPYCKQKDCPAFALLSFLT